ncbi:acyl carrier protein [Roseospira marina]|uniref:Acyl carrier protein n=1 Tax=Roseospira marina TaxID=140057 RepID=A0A5M6IAG2_9PROT|nr:phosphopantetheine-binding protein [Roseospira marina]KAA5604715.1 acyl carrier protein [Roseospira marina]MBB4315163.1 acyl carrier protein [Roseospira marina]MBB5088067.1 acyl carrier protein [Roseospira marina]
MSDLEQKIYDIVVDKTELTRDRLSRDARIKDLEISSLDFVEIVFAVEEEFDIEVPYNANTMDSDFETLGDIIDAVAAEVEKQG